MDKKKILIVEDEADIRELLRYHLEREGFDVLEAGDGPGGLALARSERPALMLLDVMLPGMDGFDVLRGLAAEGGPVVPVLLLTARGEEVDRVVGLTLGADDYVVKPFRPLELVARCKAQLRRYTSYGSRTQGEDSAELTFDGLVINRDARTVMVDERPVRCTPLEYSILLYLVENRGRVVSVEELFRAVWGEEYMSSSSNTVMVHIRHLREKIGDDAANPRFIKNIWGVGYTIEA